MNLNELASEIAEWHLDVFGELPGQLSTDGGLEAAIRDKVLEEAQELADATNRYDVDDEAADLLIVALVMMSRFGSGRSADEVVRSKLDRVRAKYAARYDSESPLADFV